MIIHKMLKFFYWNFFIKLRLDHLFYYLTSRDKFKTKYLKSNYKKDFSEEVFFKYRNIILDNRNKNSQIWNNILAVHYKEIYSSLENNDKVQFRKQLNNFFQKKFIRGAEVGDLYKNFFLKYSHKYLLIYSIYKLAEYLGYKKTINPYQGLYEKENISINLLYKKISNNLPIKEIPNIGSPYGMSIDESVINYRFVESIYLNLEIKNFLFNQELLKKEKLRILEIGSGSGINALVNIYFFKEHIEKVYLVDIPEMLIFQEFFLKNTLQENEINKIEFIPNNDFQDKILRYNVLINKDSLPEIQKFDVEVYMESLNKMKNCYFFSVNQESKIKNQIPVSDLITKYSNISLVSRDSFPLKKGYMKEIYKSK